MSVIALEDVTTEALHVINTAKLMLVVVPAGKQNVPLDCDLYFGGDHVVHINLDYTDRLKLISTFTEACKP